MALMIKSISCLIVILFLSEWGLVAKEREKKKLPNIVLYFADDLGWGDNEINNPKSRVPTPNLNQLASEGMNFTDAHSAGSTCAPSRYGLLTGRNPLAYPNYQYKLTSEAWECLTLPAMLKKKGYGTHIIGKWHFSVHFKNKQGKHEFYPRKPPKGKVLGRFDLKAETLYGPLDRGFDTFFGTPFQPGGGWYANMEGRTLLGDPYINERGQPQVDDFDVVKWLEVLTDKSVKKIEESAKKDEPYFLYIPINSPHAPIVPDKPFIGKTAIGAYGDYCHQVDWSLGKIMEAIEASGEQENTILIFTSDNGSFAPNKDSYQAVIKGEDKTPHAANGPWRGAKKDLWEGGHRVPYVVRWPGVIPAGKTSSTTMSLMDHMATFAAITNYDLGKEEGTDSFNILPAMKGEQTSAEERVLFHYFPTQTAVRKGKWKLIAAGKGKTAKGKLVPKEGELYNLETDPSEKTNIWDKNPKIVKELEALLDTYKQVKKTAPHSL